MKSLKLLVLSLVLIPINMAFANQDEVKSCLQKINSSLGLNSLPNQELVLVGSYKVSETEAVDCKLKIKADSVDSMSFSLEAFRPTSPQPTLVSGGNARLYSGSGGLSEITDVQSCDVDGTINLKFDETQNFGWNKTFHQVMRLDRNEKTLVVKARVDFDGPSNTANGTECTFKY